MYCEYLATYLGNWTLTFFFFYLPHLHILSSLPTYLGVANTLRPLTLRVIVWWIHQISRFATRVIFTDTLDIQMANETTERSALLQDTQNEDDRQVLKHASHLIYSLLWPFKQKVVDFTKQDKENPRNWSRARKTVNVVTISSMGRLFWPATNPIERLFL